MYRRLKKDPLPCGGRAKAYQIHSLRTKKNSAKAEASTHRSRAATVFHPVWLSTATICTDANAAPKRRTVLFGTSSSTAVVISINPTNRIQESLLRPKNPSMIDGIQPTQLR